jgi:hypothetical protein
MLTSFKIEKKKNLYTLNEKEMTTWLFEKSS